MYSREYIKEIGINKPIFYILLPGVNQKKEAHRPLNFYIFATCDNLPAPQNCGGDNH